MFCIDLKDAYFHISNPFKFSTLPSDHFEWECVSVQSVIHQPFHSIPCLHQSICSGLEGGLQERDLSASLSQQLVDHSGVGSSPAGVSGAPSTVSRPVGVSSTWINETSRQPIGISTSDYQIMGCGGQVFSAYIPSCKVVAANSWPHSLLRVVCLQGESQDASSSVAVKDSLVNLIR